MSDRNSGDDIAAIAKGGRTNLFGFFLRLAARIPFLFIAGRAAAYGPEALGRFASALVVIELTAMICTLGEKRGLAQRLSESDEHPANVVADGTLVALVASSAMAALFWFFPAPLFPGGHYSEIDRLMAGTGEAVHLLFDTGHCVYAHGDPQALLERHIGRITHIHCKDIRRPVLEQAWAGDWSFMDAVLAGIFTVPGDGSIDYPPLLRRLAAAGYDGWLVVEAEQDPAKAHPLTYATLGYRNLLRLARDAGLRVIEKQRAGLAPA